MKNKPIVLNIAAHDCSGIAGISMDTKTQYALGTHSANVITANTAQNSQKVLAINPVTQQTLTSQLQALCTLNIQAIKVGLICCQEHMSIINHFIKQTDVPIIIDPVITSSSGHRFLDEAALHDFVNTLLPLCDLLTPNIPEAECLTGHSITSHKDMEHAAELLITMGAKAVYIKGGHLLTSGIAQDYFSNTKRSCWLSSTRTKTPYTRGTGCAFSSSLAASAALGYSIYDACVIAKMTINQGLRQSYAVDNNGPVHITHFPHEQVDIPYLTTSADISRHEQRGAFPFIHPKLGLYPIVDRAEWIETLGATGITVVQLRVKDLHGQALENEVQKAVVLAAKHKCRLFVNDYWELAIKYQAHGVHLGQEDLDLADLDKINASGLRLGTSTHCHYEVARAHTLSPSYIACGPIYHTTTKDMPWIPHAIEGLQYWRKTLDYPIVAIGGINRERITSVAKTKVNGIAMISAITQAHDPVVATKELIELSKTV